jgi:hypothetical protein
LFGGCGGDDEDETTPTGTLPAQTAPDAPVTTPPPETTVTQTERDPDSEPRTVPPEEQGDEEAIRSEAVFTGRGGKLTPRVVRVPAYIAVRVILRSSDVSRQQPYSLTIGGKRMFIGHTRSLDEVELAGLLPNKAYEGRSPQGNVRVVASAEPGP